MTDKMLDELLEIIDLKILFNTKMIGEEGHILRSAMQDRVQSFKDKYFTNPA